MPNAGDPFLTGAGLPLTHSPLDRLAYFPNRPEPPDLNDLIDAVQEWVATFLFPAIQQYTGINLSPFLPLLNNVVDNLQLLFGFLDQDTSTFDKVAAGAYLIENVLNATGLMVTIEAIGQLLTGIDNATGGQISQFFADIRYIIGDPLGLGTGVVIIGDGLGDIPLLEPIVLFVQNLIDALINGLGYEGSGFTIPNVLSYVGDLVGDVTGLVSGVAAFVAAVGGGNMAGAGTALAAVIVDVADIVTNLGVFLTNSGEATLAALGTALNNLIQFLTSVPAELISGTLTGAVEVGGRAIDVLLQNLSALGLYNAAAGFQNQSTSLLKFLTPTGGNIGYFDASALTGAFNTAVTIGGQAVSSIFNGTGQFIGVINSAATGALNTGLTVGGVALNTLFTNINSSGQLLLSGATGALNTAVTIGGQAISSLFNGTGQFIGALNGATTYSGVSLSTLLTNINSSGQILASGITGALNTAVTVGGVAVSTLFSNINSSGQLLASGLTGAINTAATVAGQAIGTIQANSQGVIEAVNNAAAGLVSGGSALLADAVTNVHNLFAGPAQYLQGLSGAFGQSAANTAYAAAASAAAAQSAQLAAQQSAFNAVFNVSPASSGNVSQTVDFSGMANASNMSGVMTPGSTNMGITSGAAARQVGTVGGDYEVFPTQTVSDYQVIEATLGPLNDLLSGQAPTHILGRVNSARTTFVHVAIFVSGGVPTLSLACVVSGVGTSFVSNSPVPSMALGGKVRLVLGDPSSSSPYAMQVLYNGTPVITYTDSSHVSQLGASYRYNGLLMSAATSGKYPPAIRSVTYQDNPPASGTYPFSGTPTAGTKGRLYISDDTGLIQRDNGSAWERVLGGPLGWFTAPPTSGWTSVNMGSSTAAADKDGFLFTVPSAAGSNLRAQVRSLSPTSNYTLAAYIEIAATMDSEWSSGLCLHDGTKLIHYYVAFNSGNNGNSTILKLSKYNSATSYNSDYKVQSLSQSSGGDVPNWLRIRDDGTNRYFEYSFNGVDWILFYSVGRTDFLTPTNAGIATHNTSGSNVLTRLRSWKI